MKKTSEIFDLTLYSVKEGKSYSTVSDILLDPVTKKIEYFITNTGNSILSVSIIPYENVLCIGSDFVTTESGESFITLESCFERVYKLLSVKDLLNAKIMSVNGLYIGTATELCIDESSGKLDSILFQNSSIGVDLVATITRDFIFIFDENGSFKSMHEKKKEESLTINQANEEQKELLNTNDVISDNSPDSDNFQEGLEDSSPHNNFSNEQNNAQQQSVVSEQNNISIKEENPSLTANISPSAESSDIQAKKESIFAQTSDTPKEPAKSQPDMSILLGKRVPKDILDSEGNIIVKRGDVLTKKSLDEIKAKNSALSLL